MPNGSARKNAPAATRARPVRPRRAKPTAPAVRRQKPTAHKRTRVERISRSAESAAKPLRAVEPYNLAEGLRRFARSRPVWFLGGAFLTGIALARFFRAAPPKQLSSGLARRAEPTGTTNTHRAMREV